MPETPSTLGSTPAVGQVAPDFSVPDDRRATFHLAGACAKTPLVLLFYRGHW